MRKSTSTMLVLEGAQQDQIRGLSQEDLARYFFKEDLTSDNYSLIVSAKDSDETLRDRLNDLKFFISEYKIKTFQDYVSQMQLLSAEFNVVFTNLLTKNSKAERRKITGQTMIRQKTGQSKSSQKRATKFI